MLQELLTLSVVEFFSKEGIKLGCKLLLMQRLRRVTGIPSSVLYGTSLCDFDILKRITPLSPSLSCESRDSVRQRLRDVIDLCTYRIALAQTNGVQRPARLSETCCVGCLIPTFAYI
jgi:hypothetical protein